MEHLKEKVTAYVLFAVIFSGLAGFLYYIHVGILALTILTTMFVLSYVGLGVALRSIGE